MANHAVANVVHPVVPLVDNCKQQSNNGDRNNVFHGAHPFRKKGGLFAALISLVFMYLLLDLIHIYA